jgi:hypothetical protein
MRNIAFEYRKYLPPIPMLCAPIVGLRRNLNNLDRLLTQLLAFRNWLA